MLAAVLEEYPKAPHELLRSFGLEVDRSGMILVVICLGMNFWWSHYSVWTSGLLNLVRLDENMREYGCYWDMPNIQTL